MEHNKQYDARSDTSHEPFEDGNLWLLPDSLGKHSDLFAVVLLLLVGRGGFQFNIHLAVVKQREHFLVFRPFVIHLMRADVLCQHFFLGRAGCASHELAEQLGYFLFVVLLFHCSFLLFSLFSNS